MGLQIVFGIVFLHASVIVGNLAQVFVSFIGVFYIGTGSRDVGVLAVLLGWTILLFFFFLKLVVVRNETARRGASKVSSVTEKVHSEPEFEPLEMS